MGWVPEMGYGEAIRPAQSGSDIGGRYPRRVGREDGFSRTILLNKAEKFLFELQVFRNRLDDQICPPLLHPRVLLIR